MTRRPIQSLNELQRGDVVTNLLSGNTYVVTGKDRGLVTATHEVVLTNPRDWEVVTRDADEKDHPIHEPH